MVTTRTLEESPLKLFKIYLIGGTFDLTKRILDYYPGSIVHMIRGSKTSNNLPIIDYNSIDNLAEVSFEIEEYKFLGKTSEDYIIYEYIGLLAKEY